MAFTSTDHQRKYRHAQRDLIRKAKDQPCLDCGVHYPYYVMDLDHREGTDKKHCVNRMPGKHGTQKIKDEIAKCDVVCSNCHRARTHART